MAYVSQRTAIDFHTRLLRAVLGVVISLIWAIVGAGFLALNLGEFNEGLFFGALSTLCGTYLLWTNWRIAADRGPSLSIGADGIVIPAFSNQLVLWDDITELSAYERFHIMQIGVSLRDIGKYRPPRNWYDRLNFAFGLGSPGLPLDNYDQSAGSLLRALERFAPPRLLPIVIPKPGYWIFKWSRNFFWGVGGLFLFVIFLADAPGIVGGAIADGYRNGNMLPQDDPGGAMVSLACGAAGP